MTATAERVQMSPRLIELLMQYHGGGSSGVYSVGSRLFDGHEVLRSDEHVVRAIAELRQHQVWLRAADVSAHQRSSDMDDCEKLIGWLEEDQDLIAHRRIGEVDIYIECLQPTPAQWPRYRYRCRLRAHCRTQEWAEWRCTIIEPQRGDVAVDSDEAYDEVARAALTFALCGINEDEEGDYPDDTTRQVFEARGGWCYESDDSDQYLVTRP